jgi:hypothetical protein
MLDTCTPSQTVVVAMRLAASERPAGRPLMTGRVLAALARVDLANDWQAIWLHTGDPVSIGLADVPDDPESSGPANRGPLGQEPGNWEGVPLSGPLADALRLVDRICASYQLLPVPSGALALGLLSDPANGAARALLRAGGVTHEHLLKLVQSELLDTLLEGVGDLRAAESAGAPAAQVASIPAGVGQGSAESSQVAATMAAAATYGTGRRSSRRAVFGWRALSCAGLVLAAMAVFWHRQFLPPTTPLVVPPYPVPAVAHRMLTLADVPKPPTGTGGWLSAQAGPPTGGLFTGTGRFRADLRHMGYAGAWQRTWITADGQQTFMVAGFELRNRGFAPGLMSSQCQPKKDKPLPGAAHAGYIVREPMAAEACAVAVRGRTVLSITARSDGRHAARIAWREVRTGMRRQLPRVPATATNLPPISTAGSATRIAILSTLMGLVLGIPLLLGLVTVSRDRSSWRRLRSRFRLPGSSLSPPGRSGAKGSFSVDSLVSMRLARHTALVLARVAVIAWVMRATERTGFGFRATGAALAGAIVAILAAEWLVRRRNPAPWRPAIFGGPRWIIGAVSLLFSAVIAGAGIALVYVGTIFSALDVSTVSSDFVVGQFGRALPVFGAVLILAALLPFTLGRRLGMRALRNQARSERPGNEEQHPVLLLRSFADDRRLLRARRLDRASIVERLCMRRFERFEEVAASALAAYGPVLALSQVGEKLPPPLGAERRSFSMADWKDRIRELIDSARLICVTVGRSESLLWEIGQIRAAGALERAIFLLPPTSQAEQRRRLVVLAHALGVGFTLLDQTAPGRDVLAVVMAPDRSPVVITGSAPDDVGYEAALGAWALAVTGDKRNFPAGLRQLSTMLATYATADGREAQERAAASRVQRQAPKMVIYKPGQAPAHMPWTRRMVSRRFLPWTLSLIIPAAVTLALGHNDQTATLHQRYGITLLASDQSSSAVYAVYGGHLIQQVDFDHPASHPVTLVKNFVTALVVSGTSAYYTSQYTGHVGRINLRTRRVLWIRRVSPGVQSPVLAGGRVVVTSPVTHAIEELSAADGHVIGRRHLPGTPYGVTGAGGRLYVTLARTNKVVELNAKSLAPVATVKVPSGPRAIFTQGRQVWVLCSLAHELITLGTQRAGSPPVNALFLSVQEPSVFSGADWLAIQGQEWVTVVSPRDLLARIPLDLPGISSVATQADGSVIVAYSSGEIDKLGPAKS